MSTWESNSPSPLSYYIPIPPSPTLFVILCSVTICQSLSSQLCVNKYNNNSQNTTNQPILPSIITDSPSKALPPPRRRPSLTISKSPVRELGDKKRKLMWLIHRSRDFLLTIRTNRPPHKSINPALGRWRRSRHRILVVGKPTVLFWPHVKI